MKRSSTSQSRSRRRGRVSRPLAEKGTPSALDQRWPIWVLLVLLLLLGAALRFYHLDDKSLWYDELGTAMYTAPDKSPLEVVRSPLEVPVIPAPPLYFLSTYLFRQISDSESLLRLPSVFYGLLAIAATYVLGKALLGPREGLIGAFLLTISSFQIRYSQEARYYALLLLLAILSLYFFYRGLHRNDRLSWVGYIISSTLAVYTHLFAFLFLGVEAIYAVVHFAARRLRSHDAAARRGRRSRWRDEPFFSFLLSALVMALVYLPMLPFTVSGLLSRKGLGGHIPTTINRASLSYLAAIVDLFGAGPGLAFLCYLAALGLGLYFLARRARQQLVLAALWITLPFLVVFLVPTGHNFRLRYVIFILPLSLLVVSAGLIGLSDFISPWLVKRIRREKMVTLIRPATVAIACVVFSVLSLVALQRYWDEGKQPWDKAAAFLRSVVGHNETVIATAEGHAQRLLYYGYDASEVEYLVPCPCPALVTLEDWYGFPELASAHYQAWFLAPNPNYRDLRPDGQLANELEGYIILPPIVFKGHANSNVVETDLMAPFMTSDVGVVPVLPPDSRLTGEQIIELGSMLARQAEELHPGDTRFGFTLGELSRYYGSEDEAIAHYQTSIADDPRFYSAYEGLALINVMRGETGKAVDLYDELFEMGVIYESYYHVLLGSVHMIEGDMGAAIAEFTEAVAMDGDNVEHRLLLGDAYRAVGQLDEALAQYDEITRLDRSYAAAYSRRARIYQTQGRLTEAVGEYQRAVQLRPDSPFYHARLADIYWQGGLLDEALAEAEEAARLGEQEATYHVLLGKTYRALGRLSEAIGEFEEAVRLEPTVASYYLDLGDTYRLAGRDGEAIAAYERVLELDPGNQTATQRLQELR